MTLDRNCGYFQIISPESEAAMSQSHKNKGRHVTFIAFSTGLEGGGGMLQERHPAKSALPASTHREAFPFVKGGC